MLPDHQPRGLSWAPESFHIISFSIRFSWESYWIQSCSQSTALEFVGVVFHDVEVDIEETILCVPCWHFLHDLQACSLLPLIVIDAFSLFWIHNDMFCYLFCGKLGLFWFVYSWMHIPMKLLQNFLHKYKWKHLAVKYVCIFWVMGHAHYLRFCIVPNRFRRILH